MCIKSNTYTFFDVETPNRHNDSICSIGIVQTDHLGQIIKKDYFLVDPEENFDEVNIRIHGISHCDVLGKPTFEELWNSHLRKFFSNKGAIAHNASFDLSVLSKALLRYGIDSWPTFTYADTLYLSRLYYPHLNSYKLTDVCHNLGIKVGAHHHALHDAEMCRKVFLQVSSQLDNPYSVFNTYEPTFLNTAKRSNNTKRLSTKSEELNNLRSVFLDVIEDHEIDIQEAICLISMIENSETLLERPSVNYIYNYLIDAVQDGEISMLESSKLFDMINKMANPLDKNKPTHGVEFHGKNFCLTGSFQHGTKADIASYIQQRGGEVIKSVTKKCNYVVVGGDGSENYAHGDHGSKVEKALEWQAKGVPVAIVSEADIYEVD